MIENLRIQNFKCWQDTGNIDLQPITVFFGANSSGKSSIGQFLMLLKQSIESSDRNMVFFTGNENTPVDLGLPKDLIYKTDLDRHIKFSYDWKINNSMEINDAIHGIRHKGKHLHYHGDVCVDKNKNTLSVEDISYRISTIDNGDVSFSLEKSEQNISNKGAYRLLAENYELVRKQGRAWGISSPIKFYGFPDEVIAYYQNVDFIQSLNLYHERLFSNMYYLGPLRNRAKRLYTWSGGTPSDVGSIGEDTVAAFLSAREEGRRISLGYKKNYKSFDAIIAEMLRMLGLVDDIKIIKISNNRQDYEVKVKTKGSSKFVDILDTGVGVSQVLPVLVEIFYAPPGSTIIIEQPELHLHPSAQAGLADAIISAVHARENGDDRGVQLIIESHSEHFLRRLQRRVAEGVLDNNEFAGYFISFQDSSKISRLEIDDYGDISNWPDNFFGDIKGDIFKQTMAGIQMRKEEK